MPVNLSVAARDGGTYVVTARFNDADGTAVTPKTLKWTLMDPTDKIINGRDQVAEVPEAGKAVIVLKGADLLYADGADRRMLLEAVYDSATYGADLPLREEIRFKVVYLTEAQA